MRKLASLLIALTLVWSVLLAAPAAAEEQKLKVYASFYPMYDFASKVGGDKVQVVNMVPSGMEPHDWEPEAADVIGLENADIFVYNGAGMEHWVDKVLAALSNQSLIVVNTSEGQTLLEGHHHDHDEDHEHDEDEDHEHDEDEDHEHAEDEDHEHDEDEGHDEDEDHEHEQDEDHEHDHGEFDPHVWLGPLNAKAQMEAIKNAFVVADPDNASYYEDNYARYATEFDALDAEFSAALNPLPNKQIVVSHQAFGYLCAAYGLTQESIEGLAPDSEPDPARMAEIIEFVKDNGITTIFFEELVSPKVAETIASATGAVTAVLSPVEGLSDEQLANGGDYFSVMRENLAALVKALQ